MGQILGSLAGVMTDIHKQILDPKGSLGKPWATLAHLEPSLPEM